jgi:hypothetical protein
VAGIKHLGLPTQNLTAHVNAWSFLSKAAKTNRQPNVRDTQSVPAQRMGIFFQK